ncbi:MAG: ParB/Srx family N-terminal domain-containing protein [Thermoplasmata archaeon]
MTDRSAGSFETIRLAGKDTKVERAELPLDLLNLDPENPRVGQYSDTKAAATDVPQSQEEIAYAIRAKAPEAVDKLRLAIEVNRGLVNPIWVSRLPGGRYLTIEGNTRVLAYRDLHSKFLNDQTFEHIQCKILPPGVDQEVIDFVRIEAHLRGVTPWDAYERARYLFQLYDGGQTLSHLAAQTRLSESEMMNSITAYRTMTEHYLTKFRAPNEVLKFSYFVEYQSRRRIQESIARNGFSVDDLCDWIGTRKLPRAADIRDLPDILDTPEAREEFLATGFEGARDVLAYIKPSKVSPLYMNIGRLIEGLDTISLTEVADIKSGKGERMLGMLHQLEARLQIVLSLVEDRRSARKRS